MDADLADLLNQRPGLKRLFEGASLSLTPVYRGPCVQSDYAKLHFQNASDLLRGSHHIDFATPGGLFLVRQGLELWMKCIASNHELDEILRFIIRDRPSFETLAESELVAGTRTKSMAKKNKTALSRGLCAFRNREVDGMGSPEMWTKRTQGNFPDLAVAAVADREAFSRALFGLFYVPLIGGHDLRPLWQKAKPHLSLRCNAIDSFGKLCSNDLPFDLDLLDDLVAVLSCLDPEGDALRYPFSTNMKWNDSMPPMSDRWIRNTASTLVRLVENERGERSERYAISTIGGGIASWVISDGNSATHEGLPPSGRRGELL